MRSACDRRVQHSSQDTQVRPARRWRHHADITSTVAFTCRGVIVASGFDPRVGKKVCPQDRFVAGSCRCPLGRIAIGPLLCPLGEGDLSEPRIAPVASLQIRLDTTQKVRGVRLRAERRRCGYLPSRPVRVTALPATRRQLADPPELTTSGSLQVAPQTFDESTQFASR